MDGKKYKIIHAGITACGEPLNGFQKALIKACDDYREINNSSAAKDIELIRVNKELQPDIIFFQYQQPDVIAPSVLIKMKEDNPDSFIVNFTGDVRHPLPQWYVDFGKLIDCTMFSNMTDVWEARRLGIKSEFLQYGFDPEIFNKKENKNGYPEIVFLGNNYQNQFPLSIKRKQMVDFLQKEYGNRFGVYGNNWENANGNVNHSQMEEDAIYNGCKIAINISHFDYERYSSDRLFRIMGSGAFCLSKIYPGIHLDFIAGEHLATWETFEELKFGIDYYLKNDEQRNEIAVAGNKLIHQTHSFDAMVGNLLKIYNEQL